MPYAADDMRAKLAQSAATTPEKFLAAEYVEFHVFPPHDKQENSRTWYARVQNFTIGYTELDSGSVRLERAGQPDEYVVLLMDDGLAAEIRADDESKSVDGKTMIVVPLGDSSVDITGSGRIARLVRTSSADLAGLAVNAGSYEQPHENIPEFQARARLAGGLQDPHLRPGSGAAAQAADPAVPVHDLHGQLRRPDPGVPAGHRPVRRLRVAICAGHVTRGPVC